MRLQASKFAQGSGLEFLEGLKYTVGSILYSSCLALSPPKEGRFGNDILFAGHIPFSIQVHAT